MSLGKGLLAQRLFRQRQQALSIVQIMIPSKKGEKGFGIPLQHIYFDLRRDTKLFYARERNYFV